MDLSKPSRVRNGNGERVPCNECGKTFSCNANLRDHMRLHTGEKPFLCGECGSSFAQRSNWRLHKRVHTGERPYMCGICGKTFARSSHLPGHMRVHTKERPFTCERCSNSFGSQQALKNHMRTHTGEKPFQCKFCDTSFTHSSSLSSHKKRCTGHKRKRGRPLGTGHKSYKRKVTGRPRGRPKKRLRGFSRAKKKAEVAEDKDALNIKAESITEDDFQNINGNLHCPAVDSTAAEVHIITPDFSTGDSLISNGSLENADLMIGRKLDIQKLVSSNPLTVTSYQNDDSNLSDQSQPIFMGQQANSVKSNRCENSDLNKSNNPSCSNNTFLAKSEGQTCFNTDKLCIQGTVASGYTFIDVAENQILKTSSLNTSDSTTLPDVQQDQKWAKVMYFK